MEVGQRAACVGHLKEPTANGRLGPGRDQKGNICADVFACVLFLSFHSIFRVVF